MEKTNPNGLLNQSADILALKDDRLDEVSGGSVPALFGLLGTCPRCLSKFDGKLCRHCGYSDKKEKQ